ncbi:hypothetical protein [Undibacterium sp. Tian12W]|uniref:hypothetical protein n=1 Tax=Undibacterium sp. Tian12W TaxID=3413054 RepID=UPI003BF41CF2
MEKNLEEMLLWIDRVEIDSLAIMQRTIKNDDELRSSGAFSSAANNPCRGAYDMMLLAQARWILQSDLNAARDLLGKIPLMGTLSVRAFQEMNLAYNKNGLWDKSSFEYFPFVPLLIGLLLADAKQEFEALCNEITVCATFDQHSRKHIAGEFAFQIANIGAGRTTLISKEAFENTQAFKSSHFIYGYHEMLYHIALHNADDFEKIRAEREVAFPKRSRSRVALGQLDNWGMGKIAQSVTFDALGTALCRLALWRGMEVNVDTRLYPKKLLRN